MNQCELTEGLANRICCAAQKNGGVRVLDLSMNGFADRGAAAVGLALPHNSTLVELNLSHNRIDERGAVALVTGAAHCDSLRMLAVTHLRIEPEIRIQSCVSFEYYAFAIQLYGNPLPPASALGVLRAVKLRSESSALRLLDLHDLVLDEACVPLLAQLAAGGLESDADGGADVALEAADGRQRP